MDIRNMTTLTTIDNNPVVQFNSIFPSSINSFAHAELFEDTVEVEYEEGSYCPLPAYCRVEDKHLYLAGILR